jgi:hypothetical protein
VLDFLAPSVLGLLLLGGYGGLLHLWRTRFALQLRLCIDDASTEVFDLEGRSLVKLLNKIAYRRHNDTPEILAIGQTIEKLQAVLQEGITPSQELDLVHDIEELVKDPYFRTLWGTFIHFCCERARQRMGKSRIRYLNVRVIVRTSNALTNRTIQEEIKDKGYRPFGTFRVVDS